MTVMTEITGMIEITTEIIVIIIIKFIISSENLNQMF